MDDARRANAQAIAATRASIQKFVFRHGPRRAQDILRGGEPATQEATTIYRFCHSPDDQKRKIETSNSIQAINPLAMTTCVTPAAVTSSSIWHSA